LSPASAPWPTITIVTPVKDSVRFVEAALRSVLDQGYPALEHIVVDGGSTDGTLDVIRRYQDRLAWWTSEPDQGMYDALNKGFARSHGEVMGWLSATDLLHARSLFAVGDVFRTLPEVEWITGQPTALNEDGATYTVEPPRRWTRTRFLLGANEHIQQESTFWRRSLWERAGGRVDASRRMAGDFELWTRFFRHAPLFPVEALIGGFRHDPDSLSLARRQEYRAICEGWVESELAASSRALRAAGRAMLRARRTPGLGRLFRPVAARLLRAIPGGGPGLIRFDGTAWRIR
jgi:glycosyltransferase involved in cell wall biosynthesis